MFSNLTYEDKVAFFDLLDEYFESRSHLLGGPNTPSARTQTSPTTSTSGRTLPPLAPASSGRTLPPMHSPTSPPPQQQSFYGGNSSAGGGGGGGGGGEKPDMATRMIMGGLKMGASGARTGLGMLSKNQQAMDALGKMGAAAMVNQAHGSLNKATGKGQPGQDQPQQQYQQQQQSPVSPSNAISPPPSRGAPPKRTPAAPVQQQEMAQAQAMYYYDASDSGDLGVQTNQVVYIVQKTSADWWTCEDANGRKGLVPSAYLKEL